MNGLASKLGLVSALVSAAIGLVFTLPTGLSAAYVVLTAAGVGAAVFGIVRRGVTDRLHRVDDVLADLRARAGRTDEMDDQGGDEIDRLIRKADQTQHAVRKRMSELNQAESYRRAYVGDVSHEIKTPVFAIQGFAETLLAGALDDPTVNRGFIEKIRRHAGRLSALAKDLAEISRLEAGTQELSISHFKIGSMFKDVAESLERAAADKRIRIDIDAGMHIAEADRDRIRQVVINLVDNAIKYGEKDGWVRLHVVPEGKALRITVQDNGIGIEADDLNRVTERFYRAEKSRSRAQGGTGLGLSIVKHILAAHGTSLDVESVAGEGSTFSFTLPAGQAAADRQREAV